MRTWVVIAVACILGSVVGAMMVSIAVDHNPQEAFVNTLTGEVDYLGLTQIFLSWFVIVSLVAGVGLGVVAWRD
jgi:hypothetical protein